MTPQEYHYIFKQLTLAYPGWEGKEPEEEGDRYKFCKTTFDCLTEGNISIYSWVLEVSVDSKSFNRKWKWRMKR